MDVTTLPRGCDYYNDTYEYWGTEENIPLAMVMAVIFSVGFTSNLLLMFVILKNPKLRTVPNKLVLNLSFCGLFTVVCNGPFVVSALVKGGWIYSCLMCDLNGFTTTVYGFSAIITLAVISVNRYQLVKMPSERQKTWITPDRLPYVISSIWLFSCLLAIPPLFGWSNYVYIPDRAICTLKWSTDLYYTFFIFLFGAALPFAVILVSYFKIFLTVRNSFRNLKSHGRRNDNTGQGSKFPETPATTFKPDLVQPMTSRSSKENCKSSRTNSFWLKRKNRVRPTLQSHSPGSKEQRSSDCSLHERNSNCFTSGEYGKDHVDGQVTKTLPKRNDDNLTDNFIKEHSKLLLLQMERSLGLRKKQLEPIRVNELKGGRDQPAKGMEIINTKSKHKTRENKKKKTQNRTLSVKPRRGTAVVSRKQKLPTARNTNLVANSDKESSSKDKTDSSLQSSMKSSENSDSKLLSLQTKNGNSNADVSVFKRQLFVSNLPFLAPKRLLSNSANKSGQRTLGSPSMRDELRITAMLFIILASFIICWAPIAIVNFIETISSNPLPQGVNEFSVFMMFFSSVINPLIYGLLNRNFRNECSNICRFKCKYNHSSNSITEGKTHGVKNVFTVVE